MELFGIYNRQAEYLGVRPREEVHRLGYWHKSAQVFVFNNHGELLLQQRSAEKDLYANLWDYSVGEHLQPHETFLQGALRGLREELGICGVRLEVLGGLRWVEFISPTHHDREIQQAFQCTYDGPVEIDAAEVAQTRHITLDKLKDWLSRRPEQFTPWFKADLHEFNWLSE